MDPKTVVCFAKKFRFDLNLNLPNKNSLCRNRLDLLLTLKKHMDKVFFKDDDEQWQVSKNSPQIKYEWEKLPKAETEISEAIVGEGAVDADIPNEPQEKQPSQELQATWRGKG